MLHYINEPLVSDSHVHPKNKAQSANGHRRGRWLFAAMSVAAVALTATATCSQASNEPRIQTIHVTDNLYMLTGTGGAGNMGVYVGKDSVFLIDDQFDSHTDSIRNAIAALSDNPVKLLLNTHYHPDHTGGNRHFGRSGSLIVAHENVRESLSHDHHIRFFDIRVPATSGPALPIVTFTRDIALHVDDKDIRVWHLPKAHTNGDVVVHFTSLNAIHVGDLMFVGMYPFVDLDSGGSIDGTIEALKQIRSRIDERTAILAGHGPVSNRSELTDYLDMMVTIRSAVANHIAAGHTVAETIASRPTARFDEQYGQGFVNPDQFTEAVYRSLTQARRDESAERAG